MWWKRLVLVLLALVAALAVWSQSGHVGDRALRLAHQPAELRAIGTDRGRGNLLGVQPWLRPHDYANAATLEAALDAYLAQARRAGWLSSRSVVAFPEYVGTWLVVAGEKRAALDAGRADTALGLVAAANPVRFVRHYLAAPRGTDVTRWALFNAKSERMAADYQQVFGALARRHGVTIVAGSILLPDARVVDGRIAVTAGGRLHNVSAVFGPDGKARAPLVVKAFPISDELPFVAAGPVDALPVFDTPAGRLGVLICADAWYPQAYRPLRRQGARLLAVPSYSSGNAVWAKPWGGYNGAPAPADVDPADIGRISEGEAWLRHAMPRRAAQAGIEAGLNVFLRGDLWDLGSDGATIHVMGPASGAGPIEERAVLTTLWL
jgi:predicted amidohydrolase